MTSHRLSSVISSRQVLEGQSSSAVLPQTVESPQPGATPMNHDVVFKIDENGLLSIDAEHKPSGAVKHLEVNLQNALSKEELQEEIAKVNALHI